ncbi:MAG: hypothetical protein ACI841_003967 [Planctomycetota bacterium]
MKEFKVEGSIRKRRAREACVLRYVMFFGSLIILLPLIAMHNLPMVVLVLSVLLVCLVIAATEPWHTDLLFEIDSPKLECELLAFGFVPARKRIFDMKGKLLTIENQFGTVELPEKEKGGLLGLAFLLPFWLGLLIKALNIPSRSSQAEIQSALCLHHEESGTFEVIALLGNEHVADPLLAAAHEVIPNFLQKGGEQYGVAHQVVAIQQGGAAPYRLSLAELVRGTIQVRSCYVLSASR